MSVMKGTGIGQAQDIFRRQSLGVECEDGECERKRHPR